MHLHPNAFIPLTCGWVGGIRISLGGRLGCLVPSGGCSDNMEPIRFKTSKKTVVGDGQMKPQNTLGHYWNSPLVFRWPDPRPLCVVHAAYRDVAPTGPCRNIQGWQRQSGQHGRDLQEGSDEKRTPSPVSSLSASPVCLTPPTCGWCGKRGIHSNIRCAFHAMGTTDRWRVLVMDPRSFAREV